MTASGEAASRQPVAVITWKYYAATTREVCSMLAIPVPHEAEVDLELADDGIKVTVKAAG